MTIRASGEDYLETILLLSRKIGEVRSIDVAEAMRFSKASVSVAMRKLREKKLINIDGDGHIFLTGDGEKAAEQIYERHSILYDWLIQIGVNEKLAAADACRIEHVLHDETFKAIKKHFEEDRDA